MSSSRHALRLLRRPAPSTTPRLIRRIATTPLRPNTEASSTTRSSTSKPEATQNKPFSSSQVSPSSSFLSPSRTSSSSSTPNQGSSPLQRPPAVPADERPPYQYPAEDATPLPSVQSSYDPALQQPPSGLAAALGSQSPAAGDRAIDWGTSYHGLSVEPFSEKAQEILQAPIPMDDVEVKPDGIIYLPEIKYRRILNSAFGPGGWGLAPRGELHVGEKIVTREFALVVNGRFVAQARGECGYYGEENIPNAVEGCKSNALTRCCKDLGIASELWDPRFIRRYMKEFTKQVDVYYGTGLSARKKRITIRKDDEVMPPYRLVEPAKASSTSSTSSGYRSSSSSTYGSTAAKSTAAKSTTGTSAARSTSSSTATKTTAAKTGTSAKS